MEPASHTEEDLKETRKIVESYGGRVGVVPYYPLQCSTNIKKKIKDGN